MQDVGQEKYNSAKHATENMNSERHSIRMTKHIQYPLKKEDAA